MNFIETISPLIQKHSKEYGISVCSPIIAQAILESKMGTSYKAKYHNYFGLKYRKNRVNCNNGYFKDGGSEQNSKGIYEKLPSDTDWYSFSSMENGVIGYFQFINIKNYSNLKGVTDPYEYLKLIKEDRYATSVNYVENLMNVIKKYDLTKYDSISTTEPVIYKVQVGAYRSKDNAEKMLSELKSKGFTGFITHN